MDMKIYFPGGKKVYAEYNGFTHETDQLVRAGGDNSAPQPFDLFLASIGTCAGIYVLGFCQERKINTDGIEIRQKLHVDPMVRMIAQIDLEIVLPGNFPEKYRQAVINAAQLCAVKKHIENPPEFNVFTSVQS